MKSVDTLEKDPALSSEMLPSVSFDINLGKKFKYVDFDYEAFSNLANDIGLHGESIKGMEIYVKARKRMSTRDGGFSGKYNRVQLEARKNSNTVLRHELSHAVDFQNGDYSSPLRLKLGNSAITLALPLGALTFASSALGTAGFRTAESLGNDLTPTSVLMGSLGMALYYFDPHEIRARKAEKQNKSSEVIILQKN